MIPFLVILLSLTALVSLYRVLVGPTVEDRLMALNAIVSMITAILVIWAVQWGRSIYLDVALVYAILGYVGVIAITKFARKETISDDTD